MKARSITKSIASVLLLMRRKIGFIDLTVVHMPTYCLSGDCRWSRAKFLKLAVLVIDLPMYVLVIGAIAHPIFPFQPLTTRQFRLLYLSHKPAGWTSKGTACIVVLLS